MTSQGSERFQVERWPSEVPLFVLTAICSAFIWLLLFVSIIGLIYVVMFGIFFFVAHVVFVGHVRGSGVKLGPDQFPDLHQAVLRISEAMGMVAPEAYIVQAGGTLNALATRFLGRNMIILYSDLLEACGDNHAARDMIIAHELGHLKCGHLRWQWLILPGFLVPFLGTTLSRAREYTCDRYGLAGAGNLSDALRGLAILAAGPVYGAQLRLDAFTRQRKDINTGFMTLAEWFSTHPPLSKRVAVLSPELRDLEYSPVKGRLRAASIILAVLIAVGGTTAIVLIVGRKISGFLAPMRNVQQVQTDFQRISGFITEQWPDSKALPESMDEILERWRQVRPTEPAPSDPFDGSAYGYSRSGDSYQIWSSGVDGKSDTNDDLVYDSPRR
jgi:Zn-dependent protease with chaperone function